MSKAKDFFISEQVFQVEKKEHCSDHQLCLEDQKQHGHL